MRLALSLELQRCLFAAIGSSLVAMRKLGVEEEEERRRGTWKLQLPARGGAGLRSAVRVPLFQSSRFCASPDFGFTKDSPVGEGPGVGRTLGKTWNTPALQRRCR